MRDKLEQLTLRVSTSQAALDRAELFGGDVDPVKSTMRSVLAGVRCGTCAALTDVARLALPAVTLKRDAPPAAVCVHVRTIQLSLQD